MSTHQIFKSIDLVGVSTEGFEDAVRKAVARAARTMRHLRWFEVLEQRGYLGDDAATVREYQVRVRLWFALEDAQDVSA
jgi:flavin-binding protein dodecin